MNFTLNKNTRICVDATDYPGIARVAGKVTGDFELVFGSSEKPERHSGSFSEADLQDGWVYAGCIDHSDMIRFFGKAGLADFSAVRGKREVYSLTALEADGKKILVIAGSDKRGTIYGLFRISELLGVSPWVWFADVLPAKKDDVTIPFREPVISKEPSVKYRGFFINDEWPSFGTWTNKHFGGFNADVYDHVFELLLRMHGNYLWPAMWSSCFSEDGPGTASAELADEYGVVMGTSHHEPCMRHGEEFSHVKGVDSPYGNDWNFSRNREGLIRFWRDGLKRNAPFENIVTVGMRGEADSEMLGRECTTLDNINYLKDVITTQNDLIWEVYGDRSFKVEKVFAVYKEVENFYYGDEENEGLRTWEGLDGTIILLSDDNHGNMRLLPPAVDRNHKGGFGMYYHLDYHGGPVSYEWVNSTYIPRIAEQMGQARECGVSDLWIVNVGDIKPLEYPLNFFMDLAYDYEKWSEDYASYPGYFAAKQFPEADKETVSAAASILEDYSRLNSVRRPETIGPDVFSPVYYKENESMLKKAEDIADRAEKLYQRFRGTASEDAFFQLVYFPAKASANLLKMMLFAGKNNLLASRGCPSANGYADGIKACLEEDARLCDCYHKSRDGKWDGMMLSEHIGFMNWNEEEHMLPQRTYVTPYSNDRVCVSVTGNPEYTMGGDWTRKDILMTDLLIPGGVGEIRLENCCVSGCSWKAETEENADWIQLSGMEGCLEGAAKDANGSKDMGRNVAVIAVSADKDLLHQACMAAESENITGTVTVRCGRCLARIVVAARDHSEEERSAKHYVPVLPGNLKAPRGGTALACAIEAAEYDEITPGRDCNFKVYDPYGKYHSGIRTYPADGGNKNPSDMPSALYTFCLPEEGTYEVTLIQAPGGPVLKDTYCRFGVSVNEGEIFATAAVDDTYKAGENSCRQWCHSVLVHEKRSAFTIQGKKGKNTIRIYGFDPGVVLMRILIRKAEGENPASFFGPLPSFVV